MLRVTCLLLIACAAALPAQNPTSENDIDNGTDCRRDSASCLKHKFLSYFDKVMDKETFAVADGVTVVRAGVPENGAPRSMDPLTRVQDYLRTHSINVEVKGSDVVDAVAGVGRALEDTFSDDSELEEGRGKKKKAAKMLGPLIAAIMMKMMALMPLAIGAIALIAGKALLIGKIALVLSAIIGLKKLLSQQKHVTYEVVAHPHHSSSHSSGHEYSGSSGYGADAGSYGSGGGGHSGWGRALDAQGLAYSAQKPQAP